MRKSSTRSLTELFMWSRISAENGKESGVETSYTDYDIKDEVRKVPEEIKSMTKFPITQRNDVCQQVNASSDKTREV